MGATSIWSCAFAPRGCRAGSMPGRASPGSAAPRLPYRKGFANAGISGLFWWASITAMGVDHAGKSRMIEAFFSAEGGYLSVLDRDGTVIPCEPDRALSND